MSSSTFMRPETIIPPEIAAEVNALSSESNRIFTVMWAKNTSWDKIIKELLKLSAQYTAKPTPECYSPYRSALIKAYNYIEIQKKEKEEKITHERQAQLYILAQNFLHFTHQLDASLLNPPPISNKIVAFKPKHSEAIAAKYNIKINKRIKKAEQAPNDEKPNQIPIESNNNDIQPFNVAGPESEEPPVSSKKWSLWCCFNRKEPLMHPMIKDHFLVSDNAPEHKDPNPALPTTNKIIVTKSSYKQLNRN